jgi:hypothetical protein
LSKLKIEMVHNSNKNPIDQRGKEYTNQHKSKSNSLMFTNSNNSKIPPIVTIVGNMKKTFVIQYAPKIGSLVYPRHSSLTHLACA